MPIAPLPTPALRVLIVEDEPLIADYMSHVLTRADVQVVGAAMTGREAEQLAERAPPDIVLVDIGLPGGMDGWAVAHRLRERFGTRAVFITGGSLAEVGPRATLGDPGASFARSRRGRAAGGPAERVT